MTWLKVDDKLTTHPKWIPLDAFAVALWLHALVWCGAHNNDGVIPEHMLPTLAVKVPPARVRASVEALIRAGLWKRRTKSKGGGWDIVSWLDYQPSRQQVQDRAKAKAEKEERDALHQWLHKSAAGRRVKAIVNARDGVWCRYCRSETRETPGDRRSPHRKTHDLTDPSERWDLSGPLSKDELERVAKLWVIACGWCNALKQSRTYDEAGMELLPPPGPRGNLPRSAANGSGAGRDIGTDRVGTDRVGSGLDGPASEPGLDGSTPPSGGGREAHPNSENDDRGGDDG